MTAYFPRLPISLDPLIAEAKRRMRRRRVWIVASLILIGGLTAAVASIATSGGPGSTGGGPGVHGLLSQVRSSFSDHRLLSASVTGRLLTVKVAAHDEPSSVSATFEAQMLASALHDAQAASGQTPIDSVKFVDAHGKAIPGYGLARVGTDTSGAPLPKTPPLAKGACKAAARGVQAPSLTIQTVVTLPHGGGACVFKFQTPDPSSFAAGHEVYKLVTAMGAPNQRAYLVEVDDQAGVPQFVDNYTPGGGGVSYVKPGSGILFGP
jgi:hypothetical protein